MSPPLWLAFLIGCGSTDKRAGELGDTGIGSTSTVSPPSATPGTSPTGSTSTGTTTTSTPTGSTATGTLDHTGDTSSARDTAGPLDTAGPDTADTGPPPPPPCHPLVIAHRGASGTAPEDTLAALELAFAFGTRLAEVDVRVSSDGHAYLLHDPDVDRTTRALGPGSDLTLLELRMLDAGRWKGEAWVGQTIPSLADALRLADRFGASLYIDPKTPAAEAVAAAIDEAGVPPETVWLSFGDPFQLEEYVALLPTSPGVWWGGIPEDWGEPDFDAEAWFESLSLANVVAVEFDWPTVIGDERFASYSEAARDVGLEIWTYTVNNRDDMVRAAGELGLDGIETDYPIAMQDIVCGGGDGGPLPEGGLRGTWSFTDGLLPEGDGSQLVAVGGLAIDLGDSRELGLPDLPDGGVPLRGRWLALVEAGMRLNVSSFNTIFSPMGQLGLAFAYGASERVIPCLGFAAGFGDMRGDFEDAFGDGRANTFGFTLTTVLRQPLGERQSVYVEGGGGYFIRSLYWGGAFVDPVTGEITEGRVLEQQNFGWQARVGWLLRRDHPRRPRLLDVGLAVQTSRADPWVYWTDDVRFSATERDTWLILSVRFWDGL